MEMDIGSNEQALMNSIPKTAHLTWDKPN